MADDPISKKSFVNLTHLPEKFWEVLIVFTFVIALSPLLSGMDFGVLKVPTFSPFWNAILFPIGIGFFILTSLAFYPFFGTSLRDNLIYGILVIISCILIMLFFVWLLYPTIIINKASLNCVSSRGTAHINIDGNSNNLFNNDFKVFIFTRVSPNPEWWHDLQASAGFDPATGSWNAEGIAGDEKNPINKPTVIEVIAIASTDEEMKKEFSKNNHFETFIRYIDKFKTRSEIAKPVLNPQPVCIENIPESVPTPTPKPTPTSTPQVRKGK